MAYFFSFLSDAKLSSAHITVAKIAGPTVKTGTTTTPTINASTPCTFVESSWKFEGSVSPISIFDATADIPDLDQFKTRGDGVVRRLNHISLARYIPQVGEIDEVVQIMRVLDRHAREDHDTDVYARDRTRISEERIGAHLLRRTAILMAVPPSVRRDVPLREGHAGDAMKVVLDWVI